MYLVPTPLLGASVVTQLSFCNWVTLYMCSYCAWKWKRLTCTLEGMFHEANKSFVTHLATAEFSRGHWLEVVRKQAFWTEEYVCVRHTSHAQKLNLHPQVFCNSTIFTCFPVIFGLSYRLNYYSDIHTHLLPFLIASCCLATESGEGNSMLTCVNGNITYVLLFLGA